MKAIGLTRCSTAEQHVENQALQLQRWADAQGIPLEIREEPDTSGAAKVRPVLEALMADARRGRVKVLVVAALDRLGRSAIDTIVRLAELRALNVRVVSLREGVDFGTPMGAMVASILAHLAEMEREQIRERTKAGLARVAAHAARYGVRSNIGAPGFEWDKASDDELLRRVDAGEDPVSIAKSGTLLVPRRFALDAHGQIARESGKPGVKGKFGKFPRAPRAQAIRNRLRELRPETKEASCDQAT